MKKQNRQSSKLSGKEPVFIVKPVIKGHGLDYLHITLAVLVIILIGVAFALTFSKPATVVTQSCQSSNSIAGCGPAHNQSQVLSAAEHALVYYGNINSSLSLLPYYSLINSSTAYYVPSGKYWLVLIPYLSPFNRAAVLNFSMLIYDSNLSVKSAFVNSLTPINEGGKSVVGLGTVGLDNTAVCNTTRPLPVYLITDPYAPGALPAIRTTINASAKYGDSIDVKYFMVFSSYAIAKYQGYGVQQTQQLGNYMYCASKQQNFRQFISNLSIAYTGQPPSDATLEDVALGSSLNATALNACLSNSSTAIDYQAEFASHYNITSTPQLIVNCKYITIPQTLDYAINYSLARVS